MTVLTLLANHIQELYTKQNAECTKLFRSKTTEKITKTITAYYFRTATFEIHIAFE